jgi:hypothetical protein
MLWWTNMMPNAAGSMMEKRNQENDNPVLHGRSAGRAHLSPRAPHP